MFRISLSCSAETREDAIKLFEQRLRDLRETDWRESCWGTGGSGEVVVVTVGQDSADPFQRLMHMESVLGRLDTRLKDVWDIHYES